MLERNFLSHLKLALLLSLLSSSALLRVRLPIPSNEESELPSNPTQIRVPLASIQVAASLCVILAGVWQYYSGYKDLRHMRAFLMAVKSHLAIVTVVSVVVFTTCIILLINDEEV